MSDPGIPSGDTPHSHFPARARSTSSEKLHTISNQSGPKKRGRPSLQLPPSVQRAIIRLYLGTNVTLENLAEAIHKCDGPAREFLRGFLSETLGTEGSNTNLSQLRLKDPELVKQRENEQRKAIDACRSADERGPHMRRNPAMRSSTGGSDDVGGNIGPQMLKSSLIPESESEVPGRYSQIERFPARDWTGQPLTIPSAWRQQPNIDSGMQPSYGQSGKDPLDLTSGVSTLKDSSLPHPRNEMNPKKRKISKGPFDLNKLVEVLEDGRKRTLNHHIIKRTSASRTTIASRLSIQASTRCARTLTSDFCAYYYKNATQGFGDKRAETPSHRGDIQGDTIEPDSQSIPIALNILIQAWRDDAADETILIYMQEALPVEAGEHVQFVNDADRRGVSPLHLAVAYGYLKTCGFLLNHGADHEARTTKDESIRSFARPAQTLAKANIPLYASIFQCRQFAGKGKPPPVPKLVDVSKSAGRKRERQATGKTQKRTKTERTDGSQDSRFDTGTLPSTTVASSSVHQSVGSMDATKPQFSSQFFTSPAPTIHGNPALPPSNDIYNRFVPWKPKRQRTLDSIVLGSQYQSIQPMPPFEPITSSARPSVVNERHSSFPSLGTYQTPITPTSSRPPPRRRQNLDNEILQREFYMPQGMQSFSHATPALPAFTPLGLQSAPQIDQSLWNPDLARRTEHQSAQLINPDIQTNTYGMSANPVTTAALDFAPTKVNPAYQRNADVPAHTPRDWYANALGANQDSFQEAQYGYGSSFMAPHPSQAIPAQSDPYGAAGRTSFTTQTAQYPHAPVEPSPPQLGHRSRSRQDPGGIAHVCPFRSPQCGGDRLCDDCLYRLMQYMPPHEPSWQ